MKPKEWLDSRNEKARMTILSFGSCFDTPAGHTVLENLEKVAHARPTVMSPEQAQDMDHHREQGVSNPPYTPLDTNAIIYREGMRALYWYIIANIERAKSIGE